MNIQKMTELSADRLRDESRMTGFCESFSVPTTVPELCETALEVWKNGTPITIAGAMTGICGAAVPHGGHLISTEKLNKIIAFSCNESGAFVTVEPGVRLSELLNYCRQNAKKLGGASFLPNPSEKLATLGGMFSCNARGANSLLHGDTAGAVFGIKMLCTNGEMLEIRRGENFFADTEIDLVDLIGGSEGMLGIITELTLKLEKPAPELWGAMFFFDKKAQALAFADAISAHFAGANSEAAGLAALEYIDKAAMTLVNEHKKQVTQLQSLPDFPSGANAAIYLELEGENADEAEAELGRALEMFEALGGLERDALAAVGEDECEKFRLLRHAVPEAVNAEIDRQRRADPRILKLCTDFEAPALGVAELEALYSKLLFESGLQGTIFGHLGAKRLHFNLLPRSFEEFEKGKSLIFELAQRLSHVEANVTWENGIGKTKKELYNIFAGERRKILLAAKQAFDEKGLLNPKNML